MKIIRWGIIGCGDVTERKSGPGFQLAEYSTLTAVMRRDREKAKDYAIRHNVPKWYDNADALINDDEVDIVYIATPPAFHKQYTLQCVHAGKPVYVEKPMATNFSDAMEMVNACRKANIALFVAYYRRALPRFIKIKELVESGAIGDVRFVNSIQYRTIANNEFYKDTLPWRVKSEISGGGHFFDLACHLLNILEFILGEISEVKGISGNQAGLYDAEDIVGANYKFHSGALGTGIWCYSAFKKYDMNEIIGSKGKLSFSTFGNEPISLISENKEEIFIAETPWHIQQPLIQTIVNELNGMGECPSKDLSGARTNWVMDKILNRI